MKVLLITPPTKPAYREDYCVGVTPLKIIPSQILLTYQLIRKLPLAEVTLIEGNAGHIKPSNINFNYDVVIVWASLYKIFYDDIIFAEKAKLQGAKTILILNEVPQGIALDIMKKFKFIDFFITGKEKEWTTFKLIEALANAKGIKQIPGLLVRQNSDLLFTKESYILQTLEHLNVVSPLHILPLHLYDGAFILFERGCSYKCTFCTYRETAVRYRDPEIVSEELSALSNKRLSIILWSFGLYNKTIILDLMEKIRRKNITIHFHTAARVAECKDRELLASLKQSGCTELRLGIDTSDFDNLTYRINKKQTLEDVTSAVKNCHRAGIMPTLQFILGFPEDDVKTAWGIMHIVKKSLPCDYLIQGLRPIRGTPIYEEMKKENIIKKDFSLNDYVTMYDRPIVISTKYLSIKKLSLLYISLHCSLLFINPKKTIYKLFLYRAHVFNWIKNCLNFLL